jgi:hypothetical protein
MTQRDNILQELRDLQSSLANATVKTGYQVPLGYFEDLGDQVLRRIKALEAESAFEELNYLSPLLNGISRKTPYSVPAGFFNELEETVLDLAKTCDDSITAAEELKELSPILSGLKKGMPFSVPQGYFENITPAVQPKAKVVSMVSRKWFRYAAAAVVTGFIITAGFLIFAKPATVDVKKNSYAWVKKNLKKVSTDEIEKFVELADEETPVIANVDVKAKNDVKELMKDVSDKDIEDFLDETQSDETDNVDTESMN